MSEIQNIIGTWKLNKVVLASKMGMPTTTFKNKLNPKQPAYNLTETEVEKLTGVLRELLQDLETVAGISFNKALAKISRKKA